jgi:Flp pilus assembly pilin Flp
MIEYSVLIALLTVLLIVTIGLVGDQILVAWTQLNTNLTAAAAP